ncbi:hypothetical protein [Pseudomonas aeruginosa]|uniref:hypothetical protein n=1 Tax=Pseudomonas aeruginosa TaxID=287 RepID=UPI000B05BFF7|nr:hypothetical protein [Pseudomonas aeruginosa]EKX8763142.1 hypothetical protein [Pseudomonas aeruginosa]EMF0829280.1 hypothetical protein [Pseudomonas aeruginosa]MBG6333591.1 hypothetical protein [Pseudomonas aeruginosa]MCS7729392.1 hypothetical protein [Pseudomonas aeruginosa]MCS9399196.1 hypothetical protein [Pseudomonas aeruginosa]
MTQRILFFTAGAALTEEEKAVVEQLNALTPPAYSVTVHNGAVEPDYVVPGDYAAGAIPQAYAGLPVFDPDNPPSPAVGEGQVVVSNDATVSVLPASGSMALVSGTADVASGALAGIRLAATAAVVANGQTISVAGGTVTLSVAANVVTAVFTPE